MQTVTTIGLDIAKSVFQVHGVDAAGQVVIRRQLKRRYVLAFFQKLSPAWRRAISRSTAFRTRSVRSSSGASTAAICSKVPSGNPVVGRPRLAPGRDRPGRHRVGAILAVEVDSGFRLAKAICSYLVARARLASPSGGCGDEGMGMCLCPRPRSGPRPRNDLAGPDGFRGLRDLVHALPRLPSHEGGGGGARARQCRDDLARRPIATQH